MHPQPSTRLAYIVLAVQIDERVSNAMAHDLALRSVDRCVEDISREFYIELESMTVLDDLNFASGGVSAATGQPERKSHGQGGVSDFAETLNQSPEGNFGSRGPKSGMTPAPAPLAELSPNESEVVNMRCTCSDEVPDSTVKVCPIHGYAHQKQQGCVCVNNAHSISPNGKSHPLQSERCTTSQEAPDVGRAPRLIPTPLTDRKCDNLRRAMTMRVITIKKNRLGEYQAFAHLHVSGETAISKPIPEHLLEAEKANWESDGGFTVEIVREQPRRNFFSLNTQQIHEQATV